MTEGDDFSDSIQALHRMISYLRDEAARLRINDVALLLGRAEAAVLSAGARDLVDEDGFWSDDTAATTIEH